MAQLAKESIPAHEITDKEQVSSAMAACYKELRELNGATETLHSNGWLELPTLPGWEVFDLVESFYFQYHDRILNLLERERPRWFEDVEEYDVRPGSVVARELSRHLEPKGIYVSAVHPSTSEDETRGYPVTGPRFYVSVMEAAMRRGPAPHPPHEFASLLWPKEEDRHKPWLTELGWTMVPPDSDAQAMHADITSGGKKKINDPRDASLGRFLHIIWKPDRQTNCTTGVVTSAFTDGDTEDWMYSSLHRVSSPVVVLDSEMCHCGGATGPGRWTASCTVQFCSSTGWKALQWRAAKSLLEYTCPINFNFSGPWIELPSEWQFKPKRPPEEEEKKRFRQGAKLRWSAGTLVEAKHGNAWFPASIARRNLDNSYRVVWDEDATFTEGVPLANIRLRRWALSSEVEARWHGKWYPAKVTKARDDWSYRVYWIGDGTCSHFLYHCEIRPKGDSAKLHDTPKSRKKRSRSEESTDASSNCSRKRSR
jgi:hypothetical protein